MNWAQFKKNVGARYRLEPDACRLDDQGNELPDLPDDWILRSFGSDETAELQNVRTHHVLRLAKDHIYDFRSDTTRPNDGLKYGFLVLKMQVFLQGASLTMRPNARPGERVRGARKIQPAWTAYRKVESKSIPAGIGIRKITLQYKLSCDDPEILQLIRLAGTADGGYVKELSGASGVVEMILVEPETYYVSVSHPKISYEIFVLGWEDRRGQDG